MNVPPLLEHPRLPKKTVYILGAGFSAGIGMPVISNFIPEGLGLLKGDAWQNVTPVTGRSSADEKRSENSVRAMHDILKRFLPAIGLPAGRHATLEDLFCAVDLLAVEERDKQTLQRFVRQVCGVVLKRHLAEIKKLRDDHGTDRFVPLVPLLHFRTHARSDGEKEKLAIDHRQQRVCAYEAFLSQLVADAQRTDEPTGLLNSRSLEGRTDYLNSAVISLNYDMILEEKAKRFPKNLRLFYGDRVIKPPKSYPPWLTFRTKNGWSKKAERGNNSLTRIALIKLHGSLNWQKDKKDPSRVRLSRENDFDAMNTLILPTWQRDPFGGSVFAALLSEAKIHLRLASRIVFIGYSFPETDRYFRYLLAYALNSPELPEIVVCDPCEKETILSRVKTMLGARATTTEPTYHAGFMEFVRSHREATIFEKPAAR